MLFLSLSVLLSLSPPAGHTVNYGYVCKEAAKELYDTFDKEEGPRVG